MLTLAATRPSIEVPWATFEETAVQSLQACDSERGSSLARSEISRSREERKPGRVTFLAAMKLPNPRHGLESCLHGSKGIGRACENHTYERR